MSNTAMAEEYFNSGFNCTASVLACFCEDYELDTELALRLAGGFGGGCAVKELCGAASGMVAVVGLKHGPYVSGDASAKVNCRAKTLQVIDAFKEKNGALTCRDLLADQPPPDSDESIKAQRLYCFGLVKSAVEILESLGY